MAQHHVHMTIIVKADDEEAAAERAWRIANDVRAANDDVPVVRVEAIS